ncbi:MAG: hypothetical protein ACI4EF_10200 [Coprococcus sp.]
MKQPAAFKDVCYSMTDFVLVAVMEDNNIRRLLFMEEEYDYGT